MTGAPGQPSGVRTARRRWLSLTLTIALAFGAGVLLRNTGPLGTDISDRVDTSEVVGDRQSPSYGPENAAVTLVYFFDYQCGPCRSSHDDLHAALANHGDARIVYRDLPVFGPRSERASAVALAAANQGLYREVHDALMRERRELSEIVVRELTARVGADWARIERDIDEDPRIAKMVARNRADAVRFGISGTPGYLVGDYRILGAQSRTRYERALRQGED